MNTIFGSLRTSFLQSKDALILTIRNASKKTAGSSRNRKNPNPNPKHRGWKVQDGHWVSAGSILVRQFQRLRFHPGMNVGFGRDGSLFALCHGRVVVTCEKIDPNWDHFWVQKNYAGREGQTIFKKHFNVIPLPQHNRFVKMDEV